MLKIHRLAHIVLTFQVVSNIFMASVAAQVSGPLHDLPQCAIACVSEVASETGCTLNDITCLCAGSFVPTSQLCIASGRACPVSDRSTASEVLETLCFFSSSSITPTSTQLSSETTKSTSSSSKTTLKGTSTSSSNSASVVTTTLSRSVSVSVVTTTAVSSTATSSSLTSALPNSGPINTPTSTTIVVTTVMVAPTSSSNGAQRVVLSERLVALSLGIMLVKFVI